MNGDYIVSEAVGLVHVDDDGVTYKKLKFLDSEDDASKPISLIGGENNTVYVTLEGQTFTAQISKDKKTITAALPFPTLKWITPEEAEIIGNRKKESVLAPSVPYPLRPGKLGKIAYLTGPPGSGKSTIAGHIAKQDSWVFYEGDGFLWGFNPYVFPNESQVDARSEKPALIGPGMSLREVAKWQWLINLEQLDKNKTEDRSHTEQYFNLMAQDIKRERERVGGDWIIAFAMPKRLDRDIFRKIIGEDLIFVVLDISLDLVKERLAGRGEGEDELAKVHHYYEPAAEDEPNTIGFKVVENRSKQENADAVLDLINKKQKLGQKCVKLRANIEFSVSVDLVSYFGLLGLVWSGLLVFNLVC